MHQLFMIGPASWYMTNDLRMTTKLYFAPIPASKHWS